MAASTLRLRLDAWDCLGLLLRVHYEQFFFSALRRGFCVRKVQLGACGAG